MVQVNSQETFVYECGDSGNKIFPIDYSLREISKRSKDMSQLLSTKAFHTTLTKMVLAHADDYSKRPEELKGSPAVPVETKLFFEEILELYRDSTCAEAKQLALNDLDGRINQTPQEIIDSFIYQLFQRLCDRVSTSDSSEAAFVCHVLMDDPVFSATILDKLWKTELQPRINRIIDFAKGVSSDKQLECFRRCLSVLDEISFELSCEQVNPQQSEQSEKDESNKFQLQHILEELLSERSRCKQKSNPVRKGSEQIYAKYSLENIPVGKEKMEAAFTKAKAKLLGTKDLKLARNEYLKKLEAKRKASKFEKDYKSLREYLDSSKFQIGEDELKQLIEYRCREVCLNKIYELTDIAPLPEDLILPVQLPENKYLTSLIDHVIKNSIESNVEKFNSLYEAFLNFKYLRPIMSENLQLFQNSPCKGYGIPFCDLCAIIESQYLIWDALKDIFCVPIAAWKSFYEFRDDLGNYSGLRKYPVMNEFIYFTQTGLIARRFADDANKATEFFHINAHVSFSSETIQRILDEYFNYKNLNSLEALWTYFSEYHNEIYVAILLINFHRIVRDIKPKLLKCTRFFVDTLTTGDSEM